MLLQCLSLLRHYAKLLGLAERRCVNCLAPTEDADGAASVGPMLCAACRHRLAPHEGRRCPRCGFPYATLPPRASAAGEAAPQNTLCGDCRTAPPPWDNLAFYGLYAQTLRDVLLRFKYDGELSLAPLLSGFLLEASHCLPRPDGIVPMPQHPSHLRKRGFNQTHELARHLQRASGLPLFGEMLIRRRDDPPQAGLQSHDRRSNVRGSFSASSDAENRNLWIIDDIMTTGSTMAAACQALREAGAGRLDALVVARTPSP